MRVARLHCRPCALALFCVLLLAACAERVERPWEGTMAEEQVTVPRISPAERRVIREFYRQYEWPPSVTGEPSQDALLEERIKVTAQLPPGLGELPLPEALRDQLSPLPPGYARFLVGSDVVLMNARTRQITDVVRDVLE